MIVIYNKDSKETVDSGITRIDLTNTHIKLWLPNGDCKIIENKDLLNVLA